MNKLVLAAAISLVASVGIAQGAESAADTDHVAHHPAKTVKAPNAKKATPVDDQMRAMQEMHEKMMSAKTPEERAALMDEQMKTMQGGMGMMSMMNDQSTKMPMSQRHELMEKRMDMMQLMMQSMMDRQATQDHPLAK
ncbi:TPA: hypothetical protein QDB16_006381 [Burkholderia vietnamiensis]|nr:hypothetical protein [Burkholderia vietnamiensis]